MNEEILFDDEKAAAHGRRGKQSSDAERIRWRHRLPAVVVRRAEDSGEPGDTLAGRTGRRRRSAGIAVAD